MGSMHPFAGFDFVWFYVLSTSTVLLSHYLLNILESILSPLSPGILFPGLPLRGFKSYFSFWSIMNLVSSHTCGTYWKSSVPVATGKIHRATLRDESCQAGTDRAVLQLQESR